MNQSKIVILSILLVALCVLGGLLVKSNQDMGELKAQMKQQEMEAKLQKQEEELALLRKESGLPVAEPQGSASASQAPQGDSGAKTARELQLEEELARLKSQKLAEQEERALLNRKGAESNDENLKIVNQIAEAQVVGKVDSFDREQNLLIFHAIGQPNLTNGQELAVRRRGLIFVYLTIDELDPSSGAYFATVKRNEIFDADTENSIMEDEDIIIPPPSVQEDLPDLNKNALKTDLPPIPMDPVAPGSN